MKIKNEFVNRVHEIDLIKKLASNVDMNPILLIEGEGGVGKTRLLEEIPRALASIKTVEFEIPETLDFDDAVLSTEGGIEINLLNLLDKRNSNIVLSAMNELWRMEKVGDSLESLRVQKKRVSSLLAGMLSKDKRLVLRFDTIEKLDKIFLVNILDLVAQIKNVFCIFSGRETGGLLDTISNFSINRFNYTRLERFTDIASAEYLLNLQKLHSINLGPKLTDLIGLMSNGKPIIMDLAVDYVLHEINLNEILEINVEKIKELPNAEKEEEFKRFEDNLIKRLLKLRKPLDRLVLAMSRIFPVTKEIIATLLGLESSVAEELFLEAQNYTFIKTLPNKMEITLHDEMRRIINENIWKILDPDKSRRRRDSEIASAIFKERVDLLRSQIKLANTKTKENYEMLHETNSLKQARDVFSVKWLEHLLFFNLRDGLVKSKEIIDNVRGAGKFELIQKILNLQSDYYDQGLLDSEQAYTYIYYLGRLNIDKGEIDLANKVFNQLLLENKNNPIRKRGIYNMLGKINTKLGNWDLALKFQLDSRKLISHDNYGLIANLENQIGYIYRNLEDISSKNLDKALKHYNNALSAARANNRKLSSQAKKDNHELIASILNNIGYVWGLKQNYNQANQFCKDAIVIWEQVGDKVKIALAETALGILERDQGNFDTAIRLFNSALGRVVESKASESSTYEILCRTKFHLGWALWFKAVSEEEIDLSIIDQSIHSLEESKRLAELYEIQKELPGIYHQLASVYWRSGIERKDDAVCKKAREINQIAYSLSEKLGNIHYAIDSIVGMAEFDLDDMNDGELENYVQMLAPYQKYGFPLYFGRMERIIGDFHFLKKNYSDAFDKYSKGLNLINLHGGFGPYSVIEELDLLSRKIETLQPDEAIYWVRYLGKCWNKTSNRKHHVNLVVWAEQMLLKLDLR